MSLIVSLSGLKPGLNLAINLGFASGNSEMPGLARALPGFRKMSIRKMSIKMSTEMGSPRVPGILR
jgi:hypothetical protein